MEKFHLPILQDNPFEPRVESKEKELPVEFKIARAFLFQKYPLSEKGEELRKRVVEVVQSLKRNPEDKDVLERLHELKSELPTVEEPHLEMFAELDISPEDEEKYLGSHLVNIQVTKGCRHQCDHCAAGAEKDVKIMPFAAVLKIADKIIRRDVSLADLEGEARQSIEDFFCRPEIQSLVDEIREENEEAKHSAGRVIHYLTTTGNLNLLDLQKLFWYIESPPYPSYLEQDIRKFLGLLMDLPALRKAGEKLGKEGWKILESLEEGSGNGVVNYYDSDPFDYRDTTFLHQDGTPADYGDVVEALITKIYPIEFTTAGWPEGDAVAQRAADKICRLPRKYFFNPRISLHPYEIGTSQGNPEVYFASMENVLTTLAPIRPKIVYMEDVFKAEHGKYKPVLKRLYDLSKSLNLDSSGSPDRPSSVSRFSGRAAKGSEPDTFYPDVMACLPGIHIWPDGSLNEQTNEEGVVKQGSRPKPLGKGLYKLKGKG